VALLAVAQAGDVRIAGRPIDPAIPAEIGVASVAIIVAVGFIMLVVVADQILQSETVMGGDEIDARPRTPAAVAEDVGRARHARGEIGDEALVAFPKTPDRVAVLPIPLGPTRRKITELIAIGAEIPRLGNQLEPSHDRILSDRVEKRAVLLVIVVLAGERRGQIEAETVDMHLQRPVTQR